MLAWEGEVKEKGAWKDGVSFRDRFVVLTLRSYEVSAKEEERKSIWQLLSACWTGDRHIPDDVCLAATITRPTCCAALYLPGRSLLQQPSCSALPFVGNRATV